MEAGEQNSLREQKLGCTCEKRLWEESLNINVTPLGLHAKVLSIAGQAGLQEWLLRNLLCPTDPRPASSKTDSQPPFPTSLLCCGRGGGKGLRNKVKPIRKGRVGERCFKISFYFSSYYFDFIDNILNYFPQVCFACDSNCWAITPVLTSTFWRSLLVHFLSPFQLKKEVTE